MARKTIPTSRTRKLVKPGVGLEFFNAVENMHSMHEAKPILELLTTMNRNGHLSARQRRGLREPSGAFNTSKAAEAAAV